MGQIFVALSTMYVGNSFFPLNIELISSKEISRETKTKIEKPAKVEIKFNNKILIYISALILLGLVIYFIF